MDLSEEAKKEIAEAVKIIKEDKILAYMRGNSKPKEEPPTDPVTNPPVDPANPPVPPNKNQGKTDPVDNPPKVKKRGLFWGQESEE